MLARFQLRTISFKHLLKQLGLLGCIGILAMSYAAEVSAAERLPNIIFIFCDNLGYGDVGCFGSKLNRTPHIDKMAAEGMRFTDVYAASGVCTPSRAALMTGCYPRRVNMHVSATGGSVLQPVSTKGLNLDEITMAEVLKSRGYATTCIGKWHLGDQIEFLPTRQGFDSYLGIPYSDNMTPRPGSIYFPPLPLMRNEEVIEAPVERNDLTRRYTEEAIAFIKANREQPFFLYLPHAMPGSTTKPFASDDFRGKSKTGAWGDSVEEIDWSTGQILAALKEAGIDEQTLVIWTNDNGAPKYSGIDTGGTNAPLKGWGYDTSEGAMRVPLVARWPGKIPAGTTCDALCSLMDFYPTFAHLAGAKLAADRPIDGRDITPLLLDADAESPHEAFYYYCVDQLQAVRSGDWKLNLALKSKRLHSRGNRPPSELELFDLRNDPLEKTNQAKAHPEVVARLLALADKARAELGDEGQAGSGQRPAGHVEKPTARLLEK